MTPSIAATIGNSHRRLFWPLAACIVSLSAYFGLQDLARALGGDQATDLHVAQLQPLLAVLGALAVTWLASRSVQLLVTSVMLRKGKRPSRLLLQLIAVTLFVLAGVMLLSSTFAGAMTGALATSGILVAIIGFALRNVIADVFSGIALSIESPYRIGDWIETDTGIAGRVVEINWRATRIETRNQVHVVVPNGRMAIGRLTNYSAPRPYYRTQVPVVVDFEVPVERAKRILLAAVKATPGIRPTPVADVKADGYDKHGIRYLVRYWLTSFADEAESRDAVISNVDRFLRAAGLPVPFRERVTIQRPGRAARDAGPAAAIAHLPPFADLPETALQELAPALSLTTLKAEDVLIEDSRADDRIYILVEGLLEVRDEIDRDVAMLEPGAIVGRSARLAPAETPGGLKAVAATDCLVCMVALSRLKTLVLETSPVADVLRDGVRRWQAMAREFRREDASVPESERPSLPVRSGSVLIRLRDWMK